jgi:DNA-binding NarL/FixJ family response regulator
MIKLLIVDDHQVVRDGLELYFQHHADELPIEVIGSVSSGMEAISFVDQTVPDVVLLEYTLPDMTGNHVMRKLHEKHPELNIIFLIGNSSVQIAEELLDCGARGIVSKRLGAKEVVAAIRTVVRGDIYDDPRVLSLTLDDRRSRPKKGRGNLSSREWQILKHIANGCTGQEIAEKLQISQKTVSTYKKRIREKLNAENNMELIRLAVQYRTDDSDYD